MSTLDDPTDPGDAADRGRPSFTIPDWPRALGQPPARAVIRRQPEHFQVEELPVVSPEGEGSHCWVWVEKRQANTAWVAARLAARGQVSRTTVGYAGMKDRHGLTRQWFSLPATAFDAVHGWQEDSGDGGSYRVLACQRHGRKLQRGALRGNRFAVLLTEVAGERAVIEQRLQAIGRQGVPNYFGEQRFGHGGANVTRALRTLGARRRRVSRSQRGIFLSAVRAFLFNQVLAERVRRGNWNQLLPGERVLLDGSRSHFAAPEIDEDLRQRLAEGDIHPSGPLAGRVAPGDDLDGDHEGKNKEDSQDTDHAGALETAVLSVWPDLTGLLTSQGVAPARRTLRLMPRDWQHQWCAEGLRLTFELPAGSYATAVLRELADYHDPQRPS